MTDQNSGGTAGAPGASPPQPGPAVPPYLPPGAPTTSYQPPGAPTPTSQAPTPAVPPPYGGAPTAPSPYGRGVNPGATPYPQTTAIGGTAGPPPGAFPPMMPYAPQFAPAPPTNGLAIAGMVLSLTGFATCGLTSVVGLILSIVALRQIRGSGGRQVGDGLAIAGIAVGAVFTVLFGLIWIASVVGS